MDLLDRLYQRLVSAVEDAPSTAPTVASVYQHLVPYRAVRGELGMWELAQYEHTLLRLLAGERGYVEVADPEARRELQRELASPSPILGVYRDYADCAVRIAGASTPAAGEPEPEPLAEPEPFPEPEPLPQPRPTVRVGAVAASRPAATPALRAPSSPTVCRACSTPLPGVDGLRFCPSCGTDQQEVPCGACGTLLRAEWNFCIRCGRPRSDLPVRA